MASNSSTIADANGGFDDWVELYNPGSSSVDISGYYISDDASNQNKRQLPNNSASLVIPADGYLLLWFDAEPLQGADHVDLKLGAGGEDIVLVANDGTTVIDSYIALDNKTRTYQKEEHLMAEPQLGLFC
jgi:hypothetical protein